MQSGNPIYYVCSLTSVLKVLILCQRHELLCAGLVVFGYAFGTLATAIPVLLFKRLF